MSFESMSMLDVSNLVSRDAILDNTTAEEQIGFIEDQIRDPFDSGDTNYFRKLKKTVSADRLDEICEKLFDNITDKYPGLEFDIGNYDQRLDDLFGAVYKFFIRSISKHMYVFLREYLGSSKNRKLIVAPYLNTKLPNYPKEQYGKKEYYILVTKLQHIVRDIGEEDLSLTKFINYMERTGDLPIHAQKVREYVELGLIQDKGVVEDIFRLFKESDRCSEILCKLQTAITRDIINPYLEENGLSELRIAPVEPFEDESGEDDEEDENE